VILLNYLLLLIEIFYYFNGKITSAMLYGQGGVVKLKILNGVVLFLTFI